MPAKGNAIMHCDSTIVRDALQTIRHELDKRRIPHKVSAAKAGVCVSTWLSWFPADGTPQIPSLAFLPGLARALPGDLLSLLVPDGFHIVPDPRGVDYDDFSAGCRRFVDLKEASHHPQSENGRDIGPNEATALTGQVVALRA